jgi:hypothetical protein
VLCGTLVAILRRLPLQEKFLLKAFEHVSDTVWQPVQQVAENVEDASNMFASNLVGDMVAISHRIIHDVQSRIFDHLDIVFYHSRWCRTRKREAVQEWFGAAVDPRAPYLWNDKVPGGC